MQQITIMEENETRKRVGERLKTLRTKQNLSVRDLAEKTGINISNISRIENGKISPTIDVLDKLAKALGTTIKL